MDAPEARQHPDLPNEVFDRTNQDDEFRHPVDEGVAQPEMSTIPEDEDTQHRTPQAELLRWHYKLGHLPFGKIQ